MSAGERSLTRTCVSVVMRRSLDACGHLQRVRTQVVDAFESYPQSLGNCRPHEFRSPVCCTGGDERPPNRVFRSRFALLRYSSSAGLFVYRNSAGLLVYRNRADLFVYRNRAGLLRYRCRAKRAEEGAAPAARRRRTLAPTRQPTAPRRPTQPGRCPEPRSPCAPDRRRRSSRARPWFRGGTRPSASTRSSPSRRRARRGR